MASSYNRGHKTIYLKEFGWVYEDTLQSIDIMRPCARCGRKPTPEGYDACLGKLEGIKSACCGHGVSTPIMMRDDKRCDKMIRYIKNKLGSVICYFFGHDGNFYEHNYGYSYGSMKQYKDKWYCKRCGIGDYRHLSVKD